MLRGKVSRAGRGTAEIAECVWNGYLTVICRTEGLSPVQRAPALVFAYMSEVMNGGHFQYFCNRKDLDHDAVVGALEVLGAFASSAILREASDRNRKRSVQLPLSVDEFLEQDGVAPYEDLDDRYYDLGYRETMSALNNYLKENEAAFVEWIE